MPGVMTVPGAGKTTVCAPRAMTRELFAVPLKLASLTVPTTGYEPASVGALEEPL